MSTFLEQTARQLYAKWGEDISSLALLLPSRRARLFFCQALSGIVSKPLWQPEATSIDELCATISGQRVGDRVRLITELYKVWTRHHDETFESFYFWGEMLLSDFDAVDKYLIDADMLWGNVRDLKILEADHSYLTAEQKELVHRFWSSFRAREGLSGEQEQFMRIWRTLGTIYHEYRAQLAAQGMAYTGMMHRAAIERIARGEVPEQTIPSRFAVVGFNALTECEKQLFDFLRREAQVDFFWDYDHYYLSDTQHEAGLFMRADVQRFPPSNTEGHRHFEQQRTIHVVSAPSDTLQCKYVHRFLKGLENPGQETAIVLCDETLLETLLYSMPEDVGAINVTMGYPLRSTPLYSLVERLLELQNRRRGAAFYRSDVLGLLRHPSVGGGEEAVALVEAIERSRRIYIPASELAGFGTLFTPKEGWEAIGEWIIEETGSRKQETGALNELVAEQVRKLIGSLENCEVELSEKVFASLLRRQLQGVRIPYEGEPLEGVQVMGFLETRTLDFENVVVLSLADDILPGSVAGGSSMIPYSLRVGYGLPTAAHHEAMYAYYFYRLLQRAKNIHLVYCSRSDERRRGEASRYVYQLDYESPHQVVRHEIALDAHPAPIEAISIPKTGQTLDRLNRYLDEASGRRLSPTAFFNYIVCPLRFYYRSVAGIVIEPEMDEGVDGRTLGNILHAAAETLYKPFLGQVDPPVGELAGSQAVGRAVEEAIGKEFLGDASASRDQWGGRLQIAAGVVERYLARGILPFDARQRGLVVEALEERLEAGVEFAGGTAWFGGVADRIDSLAEGLRRVVDYKTSRIGASLVMEFDGVESLFGGERRAAGGAAVQTLLYAMMLHRQRGVDVQPAIYAVRHLHQPDYSPLLLDRRTGMHVRRYSDYAAAFEEQLRQTLCELFDPAMPFTQCEETKQCLWCDYKKLCGR